MTRESDAPLDGWVSACYQCPARQVVNSENVVCNTDIFLTRSAYGHRLSRPLSCPVLRQDKKDGEPEQMLKLILNKYQ